MQKLVSRNPVQRFKEGKKIIKAQLGVRTAAPERGTTFGDWMRKQTSNGYVWQNKIDNSIIQPGREVLVNGNYLKGNGTYTSASLRNQQPVPTPAVETPAASTPKPAAKPTPRIGKRIPSPIFYGTKAGGQVTNGLGSITPEQKAKLISTGQFTDADFASTKNLQTALNKYFAGDNAGSIKVDNLWGNQTQKAFDLALSKADSPQIAGAPTIFAVPQPLTIPAQLPKINVETPARTFNRSEIRQYMRDKGLNPYSFTGAQRKALRMIMNGQGTDEDKAVVQGMGIFKRGGNILPSRDPITRFKNRNFKMAAQ